MRERRGYHRLSRRGLVVGTGAALVGCGAGATNERAASSSSSSSSGKTLDAPMWGVASGEVTSESAVVWSRGDRDGSMEVEWSTSSSFASAKRVAPVHVTSGRDFTAVTRLDGLPSDARIHYRARFLSEAGLSAWTMGTLRTPPRAEDPSSRSVTFAWSGDVNGQGWGIDESRGGMPAFSALRARAPELYVGLGDAIYADNPIPPSIALPDGSLWTNLVTEAKSHVAETLADYRGAFLYSRHCREVRAFTAEVPTFSIWDDHEVRNNWWPGQVITDDRYTEKRTDVLMGPARRAMDEYSPVLPGTRSYRSFRWGPLLEIFLLDGRSFRTPNEPVPELESFLGSTQLAWLEDALSRSTAVWKVIACDMPIGLMVSEPGTVQSAPAFDGFANGNGPPAGRELELVRLFGTMKKRDVKNVVFLTADVHYAAAHRFSRAAIPFWEFVAGPLHATAFPRKALDDTFGPELVYASASRGHTLGSPADPSTQSFGLVRIDGATRTMTVTLVDGRGRDLHVTVLRAS